MKNNIVLVIVDCLRYDAAMEMSFLESLGRIGKRFDNHWATSHCTDPCVTHMLTGKHPDELRLYSMMFNRREYTIPDTRSIFHTANEMGYETAFVTNLRRWYDTMFGAKHFVDSRYMPPDKDYEIARGLVGNLTEPYLLVLHTDHMHTAYYGGSYQSAAKYTNDELAKLFVAVDESRTVFIVTADHGEGLGQAGPDKMPIRQHGYGLWDFITHIPLVVSAPDKAWPQDPSMLTSHAVTYHIMDKTIRGEMLPIFDFDYVFQVGATPRFFHRGVVDRASRQFSRCVKKDGVAEKYWVGDFSGPEDEAQMELTLRDYCKSIGIKYGELSGEAEVIARLEGLGYWNRD